LCTGLFDNKKDDLSYYKEILKNYTKKKLICTNPDLTVHRGNVEEYCAGSVAKIFESLGGRVVYFGKPHKEIYKMCFSNKEKTLAIGDNLNTDIKGANNMKIDSIFISNGVHRSEFKKESELITLSSKYKVKFSYYQSELIW
jgi:HAD superfamily hydrolase (TIGR01459 family)